jgi:tetratricopeptide (TPR) repeat protein
MNRVRTVRLLALIVVGGALIGGAWWLRNSRWAQERRLKKTDLPTLIALATEQPRRPLVHFYLGTALFNAQRVEEAAESFNRCIQLDPRFARAYVGLGTCAMKMNRPPIALDAMQQAVKYDPNSAEAHFMLGTLYMDFLNSNSSALPELLKATELDPKNDGAWYRLAECRSALSQPNEAIEAAKKALNLKNAEPYLRRALQLEPSDPEAHYSMAKLYLSRSPRPQDVEKAAREAKQAVQLDPEMPPIHVILGEVAMRQGKMDEAVQRLQRALSLDPENDSATFKLAEVYRRTGKMEQARQLVEEFQRRSNLKRDIKNLIDRIKHRPKDASLRLRVARLLREQGDLFRAANQYQVCLSLQPKNETAKKELKEVMEQVRAQQGKAPHE